ncbi:hypothetical protein CDCA_CDCA10G3027 [Cyanidium caldarium]|uniref:Mannose-P-dolichol utilization defect 1 protein homolog n=1 Tax=Cyanidium caldarium TaxID=2771 RepID=A0AAV9IXE3_CYACA|nr:hypothetical protein CDCA_CDCA10G3027 [Cyanidium caldarium]
MNSVLFASTYPQRCRGGRPTRQPDPPYVCPGAALLPVTGAFHLRPPRAVLRPRRFSSPRRRVHRGTRTLSNQLTSTGSPRLTLLLSLVVGWLVIVGSALHKLPQVYRICKARSARGISFLAYAVETLSISFSLCYAVRHRFPFETYGESAFVLVQNVAIIALMHRFEPQPDALTTGLFMAAQLSLLWVLLSPAWTAMSTVSLLQALSIPLLNGSRVPQIIANWRNRSTGQLSLITLLLQLLGNVARIFTTLVQLQGNGLYLVGCVTAGALNAVLVVQYYVYAKRRGLV